MAANQQMKKSARAIMQRAFQISGIIMPTEYPDADDTQFGIDNLNDLISQWRNEDLWSYANKVYNFNVYAGQISYTIGMADPIITNPQPDFVVDKQIIEINEARIMVGGQTWQPLRQISYDDYHRTTVTPTANRLPYVFAYNRSEPWGVFSLLNGPDQQYPLQIVCYDYVPYYDLDDIIDLPDGYINAFQLQLAITLLDTYGLPISERLQTRADRAVSVIKEKNFKPGLLSVDVGPMRYNIYSDSFVQIGRGGL